MKYTHIVNSFYVYLGKGTETEKPLKFDEKTMRKAGFYAGNFSEDETAVYFESNNAWGQTLQSKIDKKNIFSIEVIEEKEASKFPRLDEGIVSSKEVTK